MVASSSSLDSTEEEVLARRPAAAMTSTAFTDHNYEAGSITGLAVAATCRRLKTYARMDAVGGLLRLDPREINRWIGAKLGYEEERRKAQKEAVAAGKEAASAAGGIPGRMGLQQPGTLGALGFRGPYGPLGLAAPASGSLAAQQRNIRMALGGYELPGAGAGAAAGGARGPLFGHGGLSGGPKESSSSSSSSSVAEHTPAADAGAAGTEAGLHAVAAAEQLPAQQQQQQQQLGDGLLPKPSQAGLKRPPRLPRSGSPWGEAAGGQGSRSGSGNGRSGRSSRSSRRTSSSSASSSGTSGVCSSSGGGGAGAAAEQEKH